MDNGLLTFTERYLERLDPLYPIDTGVAPDLSPIPGIKAVLFDVYGTLLISASGDIDIDNFSVDKTIACLTTCGVTFTNGDQAAAANSIASEFYHAILRVHERARDNGTQHPEIDIVNVWQEVTSWASREHLIDFSGDLDCEKLALCFEIECNPAYPMPGMQALLHEMAVSDCRLGLISNAQFFTPVLMSYFISGRAASPAEPVAPFMKELTIFSYELGRAKPDALLFTVARDRLARMGIAPAQTLYVGNDMLKDVWAAKEAGFKAALFAGDKRSLRWRRERDEVAGLEPDAILTALPQVLTVIGKVG